MKGPDEIAGLGFRLMADAEILLEKDAVAAALQYRNGLLIMLLAYRPMPVSNLIMIELVGIWFGGAMRGG